MSIFQTAKMQSNIIEPKKMRLNSATLAQYYMATYQFTLVTSTPKSHVQYIFVIIVQCLFTFICADDLISLTTWLQNTGISEAVFVQAIYTVHFERVAITYQHFFQQRAKDTTTTKGRQRFSFRDDVHSRRSHLYCLISLKIRVFLVVKKSML